MPRSSPNARARLIVHEAGQRIFDHLVERLSERGWLKKRGVQRTDSTHVLAAVRRLKQRSPYDPQAHYGHKRDLLPTTHLVDAGYVDAELVLQSRDRYGIELVGPMSQNNQWQAKAGKGYDLACFTFDWQTKQATCPQGNETCEVDRAHRST